jgi:CheY-like chemotaxis protein
MGGGIGVHSEPGRGSEFWFTVRLGVQPEGAQQRPAIPADLQNVRVLIVDDNATNREILRAQLVSWGMRPAEAPDGPMALQELYHEYSSGDPFRVAIIDMQMPGMDGAALGQVIRSDERLRSMVLVLMPSLIGQGDAARVDNVKFATCLMKPVRQGELLENLSAAIRGLSPKSAEQSSARSQRFPVFPLHARILLADDNVTNQLVAVGILKKMGLSADAVANGEEYVAAHPAERVRLRLAAPLRDGLGEVREHDREPEPEAHGEREPAGRGAGGVEEPVP